MSEDVNKSGVYKIVNKVNGKIYVGGAVCFKKRWGEHKSDLKYNKHHSIHLQNSWNKHGKETFVFEIIEVVENKERIIDREQFWLDTTQCCKREIGYNLSPTAGNSLGYKHSEETKKKLLKTRKGKNNSFYGKRHTKETKKKMSRIKKGKSLSWEHKKKMSDSKKKLYKNGYVNYNKGKSFSEETKKKLSDAHKKLYENGYIHPMLGKKHSKETILKMSGENGYIAKLNEKQVRIIKWLLGNSDMLQREIAKVFGVKQATISDIKERRTWKHISIKEAI